MEQTSVQKLARVLRVLVIVVFVCNIIALFLVPVEVELHSRHESLPEMLLSLLSLLSIGDWGAIIFLGLSLSPMYFLACLVEVWADAYMLVLTLFLWVCGVCTAVILWQGRRVLDTILKGSPFVMDNAKSLNRAAVCCFVISGAALVRTIWGIAYYQSVSPMFTYNALFVPIFLMAGLLCMVVSALFRQAAELKTENDLTI